MLIVLEGGGSDWVRSVDWESRSRDSRMVGSWVPHSSTVDTPSFIMSSSGPSPPPRHSEARRLPELKSAQVHADDSPGPTNEEVGLRQRHEDPDDRDEEERPSSRREKKKKYKKRSRHSDDSEESRRRKRSKKRRKSRRENHDSDESSSEEDDSEDSRRRRKKKKKSKKSEKSHRHRRGDSRERDHASEEEDDNGERRSVITGQKIRLKIDKTDDDVAQEKARRQLLDFMNASYK